MNRNTDKIEAAMRYVYAHFLEAGESLDDMIQSRKFLNARARHTVRGLIYFNYPATMQQIADAEKRLGLTTDHTTVWHSIHRFKSGKITPGAINEVKKLMDEFDAYYTELMKPCLAGRIQSLMQIEHHVLASILGIAIEFGWADWEKIEGLRREFSTVSREFVEGL